VNRHGARVADRPRRARVAEDTITLWPLCRFADVDEAVAAFWRAYPHAPADDHLDVYIADIARDADIS